VNWLDNFGHKIGEQGPKVGLDDATIAAARNDALWAHYVMGTWLTAVRAFSKATTEAMDNAMYGTATTDPVELTTFTPPDLPAGDATATPPVPAVTAALAGALLRIFALVVTIKNHPNYTDEIGQDLGIIGPEDTTVIPVPKFTTELVQGATSQTVNMKFFKYGHQGVYIESRRGAGAWEFLAIDTESPYTDERPLTTAGQPEVREYRMRYWDKGTPNGDWTDVQKVTVSP
jgi:hypothetical protein